MILDYMSGPQIPTLLMREKQREMRHAQKRRKECDCGGRQRLERCRHKPGNAGGLKKLEGTDSPERHSLANTLILAL